MRELILLIGWIIAGAVGIYVIQEQIRFLWRFRHWGEGCQCWDNGKGKLWCNKQKTD
jgi:hypothetical protein